jgi:MFS family permease
MDVSRDIGSECDSNARECQPSAATSGYRYFVAVMLCAIYTLNFLDRQVLAILAQPVKLDLHLTDTQLGMLTGLLFALFYTTCGIPVAALADRYNRVRIVAAAAAVWSFFSAACGLASGFTSLALARMGVGAGEAGGSAPSYSIISDYFPPHERGIGLAIYSLGVPLGTMAGAASGAWIASHYGWRASFLVLGGVGLLLAPLLSLVVREPPRGRFDQLTATTTTATTTAAVPPATPPPSLPEAIRFFVRSPVLVLTSIAAGATALTIYGMLAWIPSFLIREEGMALDQIATRYSVLAGLAIGIGTVVGGYAADKLGSSRPPLYAVIPGVACLAVLPFLFLTTQAPDWPTALVYLAGPYILTNIYLAPALTIIQNNVPAQHRSTAGALFLFTLNIIGLGLGPLFVGIMSDYLAARGDTHSLRGALQWLAPVFVLIFLLQIVAAFQLKKSSSKPLPTEEPL